MNDMNIDEFLDSLPNTDGLNADKKEEIKKEYNSKKTPEEQLAYMQKLYDQAKARYEDLKARQRKEERAARTRRLIQIGGLVESILGSDLDQDYLYSLLNTVKDSYYGDQGIYNSIGLAAERKLNRRLVPDDLQRFINFINYQDNAGSYFTNAMNRGYFPPQENEWFEDEE